MPNTKGAGLVVYTQTMRGQGHKNLFAAQLLTAFGSALDTDVWTPTDGGWNSQTFRADKVSTAYNQLRLGISPCSQPRPAAGKPSPGVVTKNKAWGFGIYTARFKAPTVAGFVANFEVPSSTTHFIKVIVKVNTNPSSAQINSGHS